MPAKAEPEPGGRFRAALLGSVPLPTDPAASARHLAGCPLYPASALMFSPCRTVLPGGRVGEGGGWCPCWASGEPVALPGWVSRPANQRNWLWREQTWHSQEAGRGPEAAQGLGTQEAPWLMELAHHSLKQQPRKQEIQKPQGEKSLPSGNSDFIPGESLRHKAQSQPFPLTEE